MDAPDTLIADPKPQPVITDPQMDTNKIYEQEHERPQQISDNQPIQLAQNDVPTIPTSDTHHIVQAPDGAKVAFPKGTPPDTMHQEMTKWWQPHLQRTVAAWDSVRNAASNAAQAIGLPSDMPEWQKASDEFVRDPIGTTGDVVGAIIGGLTHGANAVIPSTPENNAMIARAQAEYAQGNHLAAAVTLTPLVGDGLAKAVKQAQARDYSGSLGTAAGVVAPFLTESFKGEAELPVTKEPAYAGEERRAGAPEQPAFTGTERRGALMSPTQIENNLKTGQPVTTPFDNTEGAMDTINRDLATRLEKPKSPTPAEDTAFFNKKEAEQAKPGVSVSEMSDRPEKKVLSIKVDGERAGQMSLTPAPELGEGAMEVSTAQLKPEFQGKGHGSAAYQQAIEYAKSKGAKALFSDDQVSAKADRVWQSLVDRGVATVDQASGRYKIDLSPKTGGTAEGAAADTALFQKAKAELGPDASISEIAQRAQKLKQGEGIPPRAKAAPIPRTETTQAGYRAELGTKRVGKDGKVDVLTELPISSLKMPEGNKLRAPDVAKYKADIAAGKGVDYPVVVPQDGTNIVDNGNHRIEALRQSGSKKAQVWVRQPVESESRPANKAPKDKATEFNPEDMSENIRPALSERMKNALS